MSSDGSLSASDDESGFSSVLELETPRFDAPRELLLVPDIIPGCPWHKRRIGEIEFYYNVNTGQSMRDRPWEFTDAYYVEHQRLIAAHMAQFPPENQGGTSVEEGAVSTEPSTPQPPAGESSGPQANALDSHASEAPVTQGPELQVPGAKSQSPNSEKAIAAHGDNGMTAGAGSCGGRWEIILPLLLDFLTKGQEVAKASSVSKFWREEASRDIRWRQAIVGDYGVPVNKEGELLLFSAIAEDLWPAQEEPVREEQRLQVGDLVEAFYTSSGTWYSALLVAVDLSLDTPYVVEWTDGDRNDIVKGRNEVRRAGETDNSISRIRDEVKDAVREGGQGHIYRSIYKLLYKQGGWWGKRGIEVVDYVGKWYMARPIGYDLPRHNTTGGISGTAPSGHQIRQTMPNPPNSARMLIHFEGWTEKWDEYVVLPNQAYRFRPNTARGQQRRMGRRTDRGTRIGVVPGLQVARAADDHRLSSLPSCTTVQTGPQSIFCSSTSTLNLQIQNREPKMRHASVIGLSSPAADVSSRSEEDILSWKDVSLHFLLRYEEDGEVEWLDLSNDASRARLQQYTRPYPTTCDCQECRDLTTPAAEDGPTQPTPPFQFQAPMHLGV